MAATDQVTSIAVQRHIHEQLAYTEIRTFLSNQFVLDPVMFMQLHGKRPEDLNGADLRSCYHASLQHGLSAPQNAPLGFKQKLQGGNFFPTVE